MNFTGKFIHLLLNNYLVPVLITCEANFEGGIWPKNLFQTIELQENILAISRRSISMFSHKILKI